MSEVVPFDVEGSGCRFGAADDGTPWVVASDFAHLMGYRDAANATRLLDDGEVGTQIVSTNLTDGRVQDRAVSVVYENGIWELIFRSTLPAAKAIKSRVKAILTQIRRTGRYVTTPQPDYGIPKTYAEALELAAKQAYELEAAKTTVASLEPAAHAWETLAAGSGDFAVADAAKILSRDPAIHLGRDRLFTVLAEQGWVYRQRGDHRWRVKQIAVEAKRLSELPASHYHPRTGELVIDPPQVRITVKGVEELHRLLGGSRPWGLDMDLPQDREDREDREDRP